MKKILVLMFLSLFVLASCNNLDNVVSRNSGTTNQNSSTMTGKVETVEISDVTASGAMVTLDSESFTFEYPDNWQKQEAEQGGNKIIFVASPVAEGDEFAENINFISTPLTTSFDKFVNTNIEDVKKLFEQVDGKMMSEKDVKVAGVDAKQYVYTFTMQGVQMQTSQYYFAKGKTAYIVTITKDAKNPDAFNSEFEKILNSLQLK